MKEGTSSLSDTNLRLLGEATVPRMTASGSNFALSASLEMQGFHFVVFKMVEIFLRGYIGLGLGWPSGGPSGVTAPAVQANSATAREKGKAPLPFASRRPGYFLVRRILPLSGNDLV